MGRGIKLLIIGGILLSGCGKSNWINVGNSEYLTFNYSNSGTPSISNQPLSQSPFVDFENISATNRGGGIVEIVLDGIRVETKRSNYEILGHKIEEKDEKWLEHHEFNSDSVLSLTDIAAVLVLDMSKSLFDGGQISKVKEYAKSFVDQIVQSTPTSRVAVVFFSGRNKIFATSFHVKSNVNNLKNLIDQYSDFNDRTALFEATLRGISMLNNLNFAGQKSLVVFTDGGDNDTDNPDLKKGQIADNDMFRIAIGLKGTDYNKEDIKLIASKKKNFVEADDATDLQDIFKDVSKQVKNVYRIRYRRSDQLLSDPIQIRFNLEVDKLK